MPVPDNGRPMEEEARLKQRDTAGRRSSPRLKSTIRFHYGSPNSADLELPLPRQPGHEPPSFGGGGDHDSAAGQHVLK